MTTRPAPQTACAAGPGTRTAAVFLASPPARHADAAGR